MRAGELRHRISVQSLSTAVSTAGEVTPTYTTVATVWAAVEPVTGREHQRDGELHGETTHRVRMRYLGGVTEGLTRSHRLLLGSRAMDIVAVRVLDERRREIVVDARERDAA